MQGADFQYSGGFVVDLALFVLLPGSLVGHVVPSADDRGLSCLGVQHKNAVFCIESNGADQHVYCKFLQQNCSLDIRDVSSPVFASGDQVRST